MKTGGFRILQPISVLAAMIISLALLQAPVQAQSGEVGLPRFPSISPDAAEIVFSWGGDLWRVAATGGHAVRLTRHELDDLHSSWSADGEWIVFASMRDGHLNLWRVRRDGTHLAQLSYSDRFMRNPAYALDEDGQPVISFSGTLEADVYRDERPYLLAPAGGQHVRLHDAFGSAPQLSHDGRRIAFTRGGHYHGWNRRHYRGPDAMNVWLYHREDGRFEQITRRDGDDGSAQWAGEHTLIFMSDRELGTVNLYRVDLEDPQRTVERLTSFERHDVQHFDVARDGSTAVLQVWDTLYTLDLQDAQAEPEAVRLRAGQDGRDDYALRRIDRDVSEAALSPDGLVMAHIAYGRVYVRHVDEHSPTRAVTPGTHARHQGLAWSPDGLRLYFSSDADGTSSIYQASVALTRDEIRSRAPRPPRVPPIAVEPARPRILVAVPDPALQAESPDPFAPVTPPDPPDPAEPPEPADPADPAEPVDPAAPMQPGPEPPAEPRAIPEAELGPEDLPELPADADPARWHDAVRFSVRPVVRSRHNDRDVSPSPDGRAIAFRRGRGDVVIMDLRKREERTLIEGWDSEIQWRWSPDSRYLAYAQNDLDFSANIFVVPADGSAEPVNITRHPRNDLNPRWSLDGRKLTFISNRSGENYDLYRVYLDPALDDYSARELSTYYRDLKAAASKLRPPGAASDDPAGPGVSTAPARLELEGAWRRVERVTASPAHKFANEMTPGGDRYVFNSGNDLLVMNWDGSGRQRLGPRADVQHLCLTGRRVVYVADGRAGMVTLADARHRQLGISDRIRIDLREQSLQKFHEAARVIGESFYRADMNGLDWPAVVDDYAGLIANALTPSEFSDITNRLMGELSASHVGINNPGPASALREPSGRLGIEYERMTLEDGRAGYRVREVIPGGPATRGPTPLRRGDIITQIELQPFGPQDTLLRSLRGRTGQEIVISFERPVAAGRLSYQTLITPVGFEEFARLKYDAFREHSRQRVDALSAGRIGYIHIQAMTQSSLEEFQALLYAAAEGKDGIIIDVRNNSGGHTTDRVLTSIMAAEHAYTLPAGADPSARGHYPQDRLDAPRYTLPINMLANEKSFSNAEILAHAFATFDRGTLVGQRTYGGVISAGSHRLIDGAIVRRPFRGWFLPDGTDMELNGAIPDVLVAQTPEDEVAGRDRQLEAAVADLLERLGDGSPAASVRSGGS
jgi:tricorn protease